MLEMILKLYLMAMAVDVRSPMPHLVGPPGCGKSTVVQMAADLCGKKLHIINVSRISPLELEGVQMPHGSGTEMVLKLLPATFWTQLEEGDFLLLDEFLRGFPEVYNGLLDIFTSRQVGGFVLPKVFIIGASNNSIAYDKALEDRLMHIAVPDPRKRKAEKARLADILVDTLGLLPEMATSMEMATLLDSEVLPMYDMLDNLKNKSSAPASIKGSSLRNLIGQAQLRHVQVAALRELIAMNNSKAMNAGKIQYVFLAEAKDAKQWPNYRAKAEMLQGSAKLSVVQSLNLDLNLQLLDLEIARFEKGTTDDDDGPDPDLFA
jgi:energy-coupling factor transporter ATP-binding protein EcfA2